MKAWRRIGCAVDFSEASRAGLESAATLAARPGAELFVIHVSEERAILRPQPQAARGPGV
ncbi:MAG TPA: universal stress protein, partial [Anaeromyxobacteraceae bacterium]|nr:universal stress protein [Anaeromyxobacteraceae bacterium]